MRREKRNEHRENVLYSLNIYLMVMGLWSFRRSTGAMVLANPDVNGVNVM
jgi:hypothetical protein